MNQKAHSDDLDRITVSVLYPKGVREGLDLRICNFFATYGGKELYVQPGPSSDGIEYIEEGYEFSCPKLVGEFIARTKVILSQCNKTIVPQYRSTDPTPPEREKPKHRYVITSRLTGTNGKRRRRRGEVATDCGIG